MKENTVLNNTYRIIKKLGAGSGGTVYLAYHMRLEKNVVVKLISEAAKKHLDSKNERDALKILKHTYLPAIIDFIDDGDNVYTVMDYISGESLEELLAREKKLPQRKVLKYSRELLEALSYLHSRKPSIIHADIKPANIMITAEDHVCLIDFNISGIIGDGSEIIKACTPGYASPEQYYAMRNSVRASVHDISVDERTLNVTENTDSSNTVVIDDDATVLLLEDNAITDNSQIIDNDATVLLNNSTNYNTENLKSEKNNKIQIPDSKSTASAEPCCAGKSNANKLVRESLFNQFNKLDARTDIYSLAATMYHMITGIRPPKSYDTALSLVGKGYGISDTLEIIIDKALSIDPSKRYKSSQEFLNALNSLAKLNSKYKTLVLRQRIITFLCGLMVIAGGLMYSYGKGVSHKENEEKYSEYLTLVSKAEDPSKAEEYFNTAVSVFPDRADAYVEKALYLYSNKFYEECVSFWEYSINNHYFGLDSNCGYGYYISANCLFELGDYANSAKLYSKALDYDPEEAFYYRDYAISLAMAGEIDKAAEILQNAINRGLENSSIHLVKGEIAAARGDLETAGKEFKECIDSRQNDYTVFRAYLLWARMYDKKDIHHLRNRIEILERSLIDINKENYPIVYEDLIQAYIDLSDTERDKMTDSIETGNTTGDENIDKALKYLETVVNGNWDTYKTHLNRAILLEKKGRLADARAELEFMLKAYKGNINSYNIYKRLAFIEVQQQQQKELQDRDYSEFIRLYENSVGLYRENAAENSDSEMDVLETLYKDLKDNGWLQYS